MGQLLLDGGEVDAARVPDARHPPPPLTPAQREAYETVVREGSIRTVEAGVIVHRHRGRCAGQGARWAGFRGGGIACCPYAAADGLDLMLRLLRRGLVARTDRRGVWARP